MYKLIFYVMEHTDILDPMHTVRSFSVAIEDVAMMTSENSVYDIEDEFPHIVQVTKVLEAETLEKAHYLCMNLGYTISGSAEMLATSHHAEFDGLHECGTLEASYEETLKKKDIKSA